MRSCEDYEALISAFIDGALAPEDQLDLMTHMAACPRCQAYFDDQIAIQDALDRSSPQAPAGFAESVMDRVRSAPQDVSAGGRTLRSWRRWAAAAAACCAVAALGLWSLHSVRPAADQTAVTAGMARDADNPAASAGSDTPAEYRMVPDEPMEAAGAEEPDAALLMEDAAAEPASAPQNVGDAAYSGMEPAASLFELLPECFMFSSGSGGWRTELHIASDGSFTGTYTDSNAGWEGHPAELYYCNFSGQFGEPEQVGEFVWSAVVESLETEEPPGETSYVKADNLNRISSTPYGLENAEEILFYLPGAAAEDLPESFRSWTHAPDEGALSFYGLYNVEEELGFSEYDHWIGGGEAASGGR